MRGVVILVITALAYSGCLEDASCREWDGELVWLDPGLEARLEASDRATPYLELGGRGEPLDAWHVDGATVRSMVWDVDGNDVQLIVDGQSYAMTSSGASPKQAARTALTTVTGNATWVSATVDSLEYVSELIGYRTYVAQIPFHLAAVFDPGPWDPLQAGPHGVIGHVFVHQAGESRLTWHLSVPSTWWTSTQDDTFGIATDSAGRVSSRDVKSTTQDEAIAEVTSYLETLGVQEEIPEEVAFTPADTCPR